MNVPRGDERLAASLREESERSHPRDACPSPDRIWSALRLELTPDERAAIVEHLVECPSCAEDWRIAMEMVPPADGADMAPRRGLASTPRRTYALLKYAAVLVGAVGIAVAVMRSLGPSIEPGVRDPLAGALQSQITESALPREDFRLRWTPGPAGARYELIVTMTNLDVLVHVRDLAQPEYRVAPERLAPLVSGTRVFWRVVAYTTDGASISSPTFEVGVR